MSSELTGFVSGLSGRVDTLINGYTYLHQQILQMTDHSSFGNYQVTWNSQLDSAAAEIARLKAGLAVVQNMLINLNINVANNLAAFRTHTGLPAITGHRSLT